MTMEKSRSPEQIFTEMYRQLRAWDAQIPESPERLDPIVRMLLQLYADQLAKIDKRIDRTWEVATGALIKALSPESKRWPVPAFTVMRCQAADPVVEIDPHVRFFYKEKREGGQTFFFSSLKTEKIFSLRRVGILLRFGETVTIINPLPDGSKSISPLKETSGNENSLYAAFEYLGDPADLAGATVFLNAPPEVQKQLRWGYWFPSSHRGDFYEDNGFCPGKSGGIEQVVDAGNGRDWGALRTSAELFKPLEDSFALLPESFAVTWETGPLSDELSRLMKKSGIDTTPFEQNLYWLRIDLPPGGDRSKLFTPFDICFDCFIAVNKNELKLFKHTGGSRLVELELPEPREEILEISEVVDSHGREYMSIGQMQTDDTMRYYSLEERNGKLVLWFDFSASIEAPPDSLSVTYAVTAGTAANAIAAGKIVELYESHPGIAAVENVIPTAGAIPAMTEEQIIREASIRLRNRDRALTFSEIQKWALTFDPRIGSVTCEKGIERIDGGVRRCVVVKVAIEARAFHSDDEVSLLQERLKAFLKSRSPVNTQFKIEVVKR